MLGAIGERVFQREGSTHFKTLLALQFTFSFHKERDL